MYNIKSPPLCSYKGSNQLMLICIRICFNFFTLHIHMNSISWNLHEFGLKINAKKLLLSDCLFNAHAYCPPPTINTLLINTAFNLSFDFRKGRKKTSGMKFYFSSVVYSLHSHVGLQEPAPWTLTQLWKNMVLQEKKVGKQAKKQKHECCLSRTALFHAAIVSHWDVNLNVNNDLCPRFMLK